MDTKFTEKNLKNSGNIEARYRGSSIAKNTVYNLLGNGIPIVVAIFIIPLLIKGLGTERFGILSLAWIVVGYFSFFDFGIGRALTKIVAEKISLNQDKEIPEIFWTSFLLMLIISIVGTVIFIILTPTIVYKLLNISRTLQPESLSTFYILAISIPIVTTTAGVRGVIEAYHQFGMLNVIKTILGIFSFLGPLLCLFFSDSLFWIVIFLVLIRIVVWVLYMVECLKLNAGIKSQISFKSNLIKPIFKLSGWMTVSNIISPVIVYSDRFLIGSLVSATAIAYYSTPYEIVTKLLIVSTALTGVLFPAFSASYKNNPDYTRKLSTKAVKYTFILLYPVILMIVAFAREGMQLWLGVNFAQNSSLILQFLAIGILFNSLAFIPFTFLHGIGKPVITAKIQLIELPIYFLVMWTALRFWGVNGAAFIFALRTMIELTIMSIAVNRTFKYQFVWDVKISSSLVFVFALFIPFIINTTYVKLIYVVLLQSVFIFMSWKYYLQDQEKDFLVSKLKVLNI